MARGNAPARRKHRRRPASLAIQERRRQWGILWGGFNSELAKRLRTG